MKTLIIIFLFALATCQSSITVSWNDIQNKPLIFPSKCNDSLDWSRITNKPAQIELSTYLNQSYPQKFTTVQIAAYKATEGELVYDLTLKQWQGFDGKKWINLFK